MAALTQFKDHLINAFATAALIGGGAAVVDNKVEVGRHDERIARIERLDKTMIELRRDLSATRIQMARIEEREEDDPQ